jgi:CPA1 family monovalent cation:H+ antiporter
VTLLALPGVVATAGLVGLALHYAAGLSWTSALLFGTIVAATDPVAVLSIFGEMGAPRRLSTIVTGESLFNDGAALVFYGAALGIATSSALDAGATGERFAIAVVGGLALGVAVGVAVGVVGTAILKNIDNALLETVITLIRTYEGFLLADRLGASGPLETVAAGIFLGVTSKSAMSATIRLQSSATWEFLDFLANWLLFLIMGLSIRPLSEETLARLGTGWLLPLLIAIVAVAVSRIPVIWSVGGHLKLVRDGFPRRWNVALVWAGPRGAVSLAAALSLPLTLPDRDLPLTITLGIVLFTLIAQGLTMRPTAHLAGCGGQGHLTTRDRPGGGALAGDAGGGAGGRSAAGDGGDGSGGRRAAHRRLRGARKSGKRSPRPAVEVKRWNGAKSGRRGVCCTRSARRRAQRQRKGRSPRTRWACRSRRSTRIWRASSKRSKPMERDDGVCLILGIPAEIAC